MITLQAAIEKSLILRYQYWTNGWLDGTIIISYFGNDIFADYKWLFFLTTYIYIYNYYCANKRYSKKDQHLARHFKYNSEGLSNPPPFLCNQKNIPFSNSMISANQETKL